MRSSTEGYPGAIIPFLIPAPSKALGLCFIPQLLGNPKIVQAAKTLREHRIQTFPGTVPRPQVPHPCRFKPHPCPGQLFQENIAPNIQWLFSPQQLRQQEAAAAEAEEKEEMEIGEGKVGLKEGAGQGKVGPGFLLVFGHPFGNLPQLSSQTRHSRVVFSQKKSWFLWVFSPAC